MMAGRGLARPARRGYEMNSDDRGSEDGGLGDSMS